MSLKTRTLTGVVFGAVMILGTVLNAYACAVLFLLVGIACLWEYSGLVFATDSPPAFTFLRKVLATKIGILPTLLLICSTWNIFPITAPILLIALPLIFGLFLFELFAQSARPFENIGLTLLGLIYVGVPIFLVDYLCLKQPDFGHLLVMAMLAIVWASDSFAYLIGSKIGKTPFFPRISPKKTWEGTLSGVGGALLIGVACAYIFPTIGYTLPQWLGIAFVATVFGTLGDLVESMLKRALGIKDSGTILPGHGGFLDRFDAFIFLVPFVLFLILAVFGDARFL